MNHEKKKQKRLGKTDRHEIHLLIRKGYTQTEIAERVGVTQGAISYELAEKTRKGRRYNAEYAQHKSYVRKKYDRVRPNTIVERQDLQRIIDEYLYDDQSPEHVAQRIRKYHKDIPYVSGVTIRTYIKSVYGRRIEAHRNKICPKRWSRKKRHSILKDRRMIDKRPRYINERKRIGDMEGDFIAPGKTGAGLLFVGTDRKARMPFLEKIWPVSIPAVERAIGRIKKRFPEMKTITFDNDLLFIHHQRLEQKFKIRIYFCHRYSAWEKGGVENRNKIIRKYIPKGSDISRYSRPYIRKLEEKLQRRIMKCLMYKMPQEVLTAHRKRKQKR